MKEKYSCGLSVTVVWEDPDLLEATFCASNSLFEAKANVYCGHGSLTELANGLAGFPKSTDSKFIWDTAHVAGLSSVKLLFKCVDSAGHVVVEATIRSITGIPGEEGDAKIFVPLEPAAIDRFAIGLLEIEKRRKGKAEAFLE